MIEITAFGMLTHDINASIAFYRDVLQLERVWHVKDYEAMSFLRVESAKVEIEQTCIEIVDRPNNTWSGNRQQLRLVCDLDTTRTRLNSAGIAVDDQQEFVDINGILWRLSDQQKRQLSH